MDDQTIEIQLEWDSPEYVSVGTASDSLRVTLWGPYLDKEDSQFIASTHIRLQHPIPPQIKLGWLSICIEIAAKILTWAMIGFVLLNYILCTFYGCNTLNLVWLVLTGMQLYFYTPLISVYFPGEC